MTASQLIVLPSRALQSLSQVSLLLSKTSQIVSLPCLITHQELSVCQHDQVQSPEPSKLGSLLTLILFISPSLSLTTVLSPHTPAYLDLSHLNTWCKMILIHYPLWCFSGFFFCKCRSHCLETVRLSALLMQCSPLHVHPECSGSTRYLNEAAVQ